MIKCIVGIRVFLFLLISFSSEIHAIAMVRYVNLNNPSPMPPYGDWVSAATNIQDAVDVAVPGDLVLVTNGVYATGGRATTMFSSSLTNRVLIDKSVIVQSVNGPEVTVIRGYSLPFSNNSPGAVRCALLTNGAALVGFTLTNGATWVSPFLSQGGGVYCASANEWVSNCVIVGNFAYTGGGAWGGTLMNCVLSNNFATYTGGGAQSNTLRNCQLLGNTSAGNGGGVSSCTAFGCLISDNWAASAGGATFSSLNFCTVTANTATNSGGGASSCNLSNCILYYNFALVGTNFTDCTVNYCFTSPQPAGGTSNWTIEPRLASLSHLSSQSPCRSVGNPGAAAGTDIDGQPWLNPPAIGCDEFIAGSVTGLMSLSIKSSYTNVAAGFPVQFSSKILGQVSASYWDFADGTIVSNQPFATHAWSGPGSFSVSLKAFNDSFPAGVSVSLMITVASSPVHYVAKGNPTAAAPYFSWATAAANIQSAVDAAYAGSTVLVSNGVYDVGGGVAEGITTNRVAVTKPIRLQSVNGPRVTAIAGNPHPVTTNGLNAIRCVYLANDTTLSGFTLTNGATSASGNATLDQSGGGVCCQSQSAVISNCVFLGNSANASGGGSYSGTLYNCVFTNNSGGGGGGASAGVLNDCSFVQNSAYSGGGASGGIISRSYFSRNSASYGGAVSGGTLARCVFSGNSATWWGGAATGSTISDSLFTRNNAGLRGGGTSDCALRNCTVVSNAVTGSAPGSRGGGTYSGSLYNTIVYFNSAPEGADNFVGIGINSCTSSSSPGSGNITNTPLFTDPAAGDYSLHAMSPCINAGKSKEVTNRTDFVGNPRVIGGAVDIGAYEYQSPLSVISYGWLQQFGLPTDGTADFTDPDGDGMNTWQEWRCDTSPVDSNSVFKIIFLENAYPGIRLRWTSVSTRNYWVERATNLGALPAFSVLTMNTGGGGIYTDVTATNSVPYFYRIEVRE